MTRERYQKLGLLFHKAMDRPAEDRENFARQLCNREGDLLPELLKLLRSAEQPTDSSDTPVTLFDVGDCAAFSPNETLLNRFRIVRFLGRGGMGEVFEAEDVQLKDRVALKMIRPEIALNPQIAARFKREILLGKRVAHPNVCRIHDLGAARSEGGTETLFLTMELLKGETLASRIDHGPMSAAEALPLIENMADGLAAAHSAGVVHRDFKSGNVILVDSSERTRAVITDFGLARALRESEEECTALTKSGAVAGTVGYMAPEQIRGEKATPAADIYSFGVVIYEMMTGQLPFAGSSRVGVALQHLNEAPPPLRKFAPHLDANWETVILCCLRKAPEERFASAADIKSALLSGAAGSIPKLPLRRRKPVLVSVSLVILILLACAVWAYRQRNSSLMTSPQRVAVLEFENIGGDPGNRVFCEGLMETLSSQLTELEQFHGSLSVVPASDVRKEKVTSAREAQRDFGVTLVITGSIQRSLAGTRLTINVVDARQLKQLRSHGMFILESDAVSMQQGVITQVTNLLDIQLRPEAQRRMAEGNTAVPGAYDFYLRGSGYLVAGRSHVDEAIAEFRHALERDPGYPLAHAGLGQAYWTKYLATKERDWIDLAWGECNRSIELGPQLSEPHITLALLNSGTGRYDKAIREAKQAIQIDPYNDRAYAELARVFEGTGHSEAAEATMKKAIALRPGYWYNYVRLGIFYGEQTRYKEAEIPFEQVIKLVPQNPSGYTNLAAIYHLEGRESEAVDKLKQSIQVRPTTLAYSNLATVYFFERRYAAALPIMEELIANRTKEYMQWGNLGDAYRWTPGNTEKAAKAYEQAILLAAEAIKVNNSDAIALSSMALYTAKLARKTEALQSMEESLAVAPKDTTVLFNAAIICELDGERTRALKFLERALIGGYSLNEIATEPELEKLRQDPRYLAAVSHNNGR